MFRNRGKLWLAGVLVGMSVVFASPVRADVDLELSLTTGGSVVNGSEVNVAVYAVSDSELDQDVGLIDLVFSWDNNALALVGLDDTGGPSWNMSYFPTDAEAGGLNDSWDDGDAVYRAISMAGVQAPPSPGLLVTTLNFVAIDTAASADVTIEVNIGTTYTTVLDSWTGGSNVTGVFLGNPVTVSIYCDADGDCDDGNDCTDDECVGEPGGLCTHTPMSEGSFCGDGPGVCSDQDTCDSAGTCLPNDHASGVLCGDGPGVCSDQDTCDGAGTCLPNDHDLGISCGDPADTDCTDPDTCDGAGTCLDNHASNGASCDDGLYCNVDEFCTDGACGGGIYNDCDDGIGCTDDSCNEVLDQCTNDPNDANCPDDTLYCNGTEFCDAELDCSHTGDPCEGTGLYCREASDECVECVEHEHCNDDNECSQDFCEASGTCLNTPEPYGTLCTQDGLYCNGEEICDGIDPGACISPGDPCGDENVCTDDYCYEPDVCDYVPNDSNDPDDGLYCNGVDVCQDGQIVYGDPPNCDVLPWEDDCNDGFCNEDIDSCDSVPTNEGGLCDDGDACTGLMPEPEHWDWCNAFGVCMPGDRPTGNGDVDLVWIPDSLDVMIGEPVELGLYAFSVDATPDEMTVISVMLSWDPGALELLGINDNGPYVWLSSFFPPDGPQDGLNDTWLDGDAYYEALSQFELGKDPAYATAGGLLITTFEFEALQEAPLGAELTILDCIGDFPSVTVVTGIPGQLQGVLGSATVTIYECWDNEDCDDDIACTIDTCNASHECEHALYDEYCSDGEYCNGNEICDPEAPGADPVTGCLIEPGSFPDCVDGTTCTEDWCDEVNDVCVNYDDPEDDCVPCDEGEVYPDCDDGIDCTDDTCNAVLGRCEYTPNDTLCADELFCNGEETCDPENPGADPITGCVAGTDPCDPLPCDEEEDKCLGACEAPLVEAVGARYLAIMPQQESPGMLVGFVVTYCDGAVSKYVGRVVEDWPVTTAPDAPIATVGFLVDDPLDAEYRTRAEWGETVYVTGTDLVPSLLCKWVGEVPPDPAQCSLYEVQAECLGLDTSDPVEATYIDHSGNVIPGTYDWADSVGSEHALPDHQIGLGDIMVLVFAFQGDWEYGYWLEPVIIPNLDIGPASGAAENCEPDQSIALADILLVISVFQGQTFANTGCPDPCSP